MARGKRRPLVEAVLSATFRAERHGGLLLDDPLPDELPIEGTDLARQRWRELVELQRGYSERGAPDGWGFWGAIRRLHAALAEGTVADYERGRILFALICGSSERYSEEELEEHFWGWGQHERPSERMEWDGSTWAYWRFVRGLAAEEAYAAYAEEHERRQEEWTVQKIDEAGICDWHSFWGDTPLEERRRLILKAGRPDLIQPKICERFGVR